MRQLIGAGFDRRSAQIAVIFAAVFVLWGLWNPLPTDLFNGNKALSLAANGLILGILVTMLVEATMGM